MYNFLRTQILPLEQIDNYLPASGKIVDLGCGQGTISFFLAKRKNRQVIGIDKNIKRLKKTNKRNLNFLKSDIVDYQIKNTQGVVISDVLHHINYNNQHKIIKNVASGLKSGGVLIIKEIDLSEFLRSRLSRFWDFIFYPQDKIFYRHSKELTKLLQKAGFTVKLERTSRFFPGSTTLFICQKK